MVAIQAVIGLLALMATAPAVHGHVVQSAPARRDLLPNIPAVTPLARLQVRQGGGGGGGGDDSQRQQQQAQQQIQQISQSFQERVDQLNSQLQSVQQSAQRSADDVRRSADGVRSSADSVIGSIRASADSAVGEANARASDAAQKASDAAANAQSVAAAAPSPAAANVDGGDGPAGVTATVTATAVTTVTATVRVNVVANGDVGGDGPSAVELPVATCLAPLQSNNDGQTITQTQGFAACDMPGRALAIAGVVLGAIGISALGFVVFMFCRRRRSYSDSGSSIGGGLSPATTFDKSVFQADKRPGFIERMRANLPGSRPGTSGSGKDDSSIMRSRSGKAPKKTQISKPTRLSMWPNFWKRSSDALSFKDAAPPTMPTGIGGGQRIEPSRAAPLRPRRGSDVASPEPDRDLPTGKSGSAAASTIRRVPVASRSNGPPPALSAVAAAKATAAERVQKQESESQSAQHSRLGSSAAIWTRFNTVMEAEEASSSQQPADRRKRDSPGHGRTLSDIPAEDRSDSVLQEYDTMVRQYHDFVTSRDKQRMEAARESPEPADSLGPMPDRLRLDRKPLRNFSRNSGDER